MIEPTTESQSSAEAPELGFVASLAWHTLSLLGKAAVVVGFFLLVSGLLGMGMAVFKTQSRLTQGQLIGLAAGALSAGAATLYLGNRARKSARLQQALDSMSFASRVVVLRINILLIAGLQIAAAWAIWPNLFAFVLLVTGGLTFLFLLWMTVWAVRLWLGHFDE
jgi:hypothetical protein